VSDLEVALAVRLFGEGFKAGADPARKRRRAIALPDGHHHWRAGFEAGRASALRALDEYDARLKKSPPP
jgi:hypothetical protein